MTVHGNAAYPQQFPVDPEDVLRLLRAIYVGLFPVGDRLVAEKVVEVIAAQYDALDVVDNERVSA